MGALTQLFTIEELKRLNEKHLAILRDALLTEIRTSPEIREILSNKLRPVYDQLGPRAKGAGSGRARDPSAPE
jgi:hypothetical protein